MPPFRLLIAAALLLASPAALAQALTPAETARIDAIVGETLAGSGVPSASVAIVRGGRIVFARAYGKQSETAAAPRTDAPYQIASVSKQFTAAAILLLQDEGKLGLDDPIGRYVPGITGGDTITIRQLLSHTSGLQDYWPQDYSFKAMGTPVSPQGIIDRWARKPLDFAPGTQWQYSNTGYVVAGLIVERVAGEPLLSFLRRRVFGPLGITAIDQDLAVGRGFVQGYGRAAMGPMRPVIPPAPGWLFAAGELAMSARDLARWDVARIDRALLPASDWALQETPVRLPDGSTNGYGLGVVNSVVDGRRQIEHSGEAVGFLSENIVFPDDQAAVVVFTNSWSSDAFKSIAGRITRVVLPPAPADAADAVAAVRARLLFDQLRRGGLDRAGLTEDANFYFTATTLADFRDSLVPLGEPASFVQVGKAKLRGGFVNRTYRAGYTSGRWRALEISTYAEPGEHGRFEQFLIAPAP